MSTAQDLPFAYGEGAAPLPDAVPAAPVLRLVPSEPLDFDAALRVVRPRLHRYATRRLGDVHEAEELVQEALLRAYSHREKFDTEEDLSAWSTVVTGRLVIDRLRVRNRSTSVAEVPETGRRGRDTADVVVARDEARTALDALDAMPPRQAAVLWAREVEGDSYERLCERFGMSEPAVRSILTRARKSLRNEYALRGGTLPVGGLAVLAPWVSGLGWLQRLRQAGGRVGAPAAMAAVGVTALGSLVLAPFGADGPGAPAGVSPTRAVVVQGAPAGAAVPGGRARAAAPAAPAAAAPRTASPLRPKPAPKLVDVTDTLPCGGSSPVQSARCTPQTDGARIALTPTLPPNPVLYDTVVLTTNDYDCTGWQANPALTCTTEGSPR